MHSSSMTNVILGTENIKITEKLTNEGCIKRKLLYIEKYTLPKDTMNTKQYLSIINLFDSRNLQWVTTPDIPLNSLKCGR